MKYPRDRDIHRDLKPSNMLLDLTDRGYPDPPRDPLVGRAMVRLYLAIARADAFAAGEVVDLGVRPSWTGRRHGTA